jgi:hypothetical protein
MSGNEKGQTGNEKKRKKRKEKKNEQKNTHVSATLGDQFGMCTALNDAAFGNEIDHIRTLTAKC